jgi:hypothetical protein
MIRPRFSTRAAAALIGIRIAGGEERPHRSSSVALQVPDWRSELDRNEPHDELTLALHADLGELLEARVWGGRPPMAIAAEGTARRSCGRRRGSARHHVGRRGPCPKMRP